MISDRVYIFVYCWFQSKHLYPLSHLILTTDIWGKHCYVHFTYFTQGTWWVEMVSPLQKSQLSSGSKPRFMTPSLEHFDLPGVLTREARGKAGRMKMMCHHYLFLLFTITSKVRVSWSMTPRLPLPAHFKLTHKPVPEWMLCLIANLRRDLMSGH